MADRVKLKYSAFIPHDHKANTKHMLMARSNDSEDRGSGKNETGADKS